MQACTADVSKQHLESASDFVPLVSLDAPNATAIIAGALQRSGFLLVHCNALSPALLEEALRACRELLSESASGVERHPSDPKYYRMLRRSELELLLDSCGGAETRKACAVLLDYWRALEGIKQELLRAIAQGLGLEADFFSARHVEGNDCLRLLHYPPAPDAGNRCKEHSDYGTITLLGTDGTVGLEIWDDASGLWAPVPGAVQASEAMAGGHATLVVNAGSLLSAWTNGAVRATLHRVAGPRSERSGTPPERLREAAAAHRHSLALFVDPDPGAELGAGGAPAPPGAGGSVAEYVRWRSGAEGEGVSFGPGEEGRTR